LNDSKPLRDVFRVPYSQTYLRKWESLTALLRKRRYQTWAPEKIETSNRTTEKQFIYSYTL